MERKANSIRVISPAQDPLLPHTPIPTSRIRKRGHGGNACSISYICSRQSLSSEQEESESQPLAALPLTSPSCEEGLAFVVTMNEEEILVKWKG